MWICYPICCKVYAKRIYKFCDILNEFKSIAIKKHIDNTSLSNNCNIQRIIVGSQAGIVPYNTYNTQNYSFIHQIFLQAVRPDAVLLCFNYYDEISFIKRTVNVIEGLVDCKVIGLVCFPMKFGDNWAGIVGAKERITKDEEYKIKYEVSKALDRPVYILGNAEDMNAAYECCTNYFSS